MSSEPVQTAVPAVDVTGKRIVAALIDIVLLAVVFLIMAALFGESEAETEDGGANFSVNLSGGAAVVYFLIVFGYYLVMESLTGQTVGKKLMGLRVAAVDGSLTWGKVALRTIIRIVDGLPVFYLVGFIAMMVSKNRQRLGDMAAGTVVVPV